MLLRDFRASDLQDVHAYASDPEVARYMDWGPNTWVNYQGFLDQTLAAQADWPRIDFGLAMEHDGAVVGSIGFHLRSGPNRTVEIGYCLRRDLWRHGIVSEAARALIDTGSSVPSAFTVSTPPVTRAIQDRSALWRLSACAGKVSSVWNVR